MRSSSIFQSLATTYTAPLTLSQVEKLRHILEAHGFQIDTQPYTLFRAQKDKLHIVVYEKGPKVLIQGRGSADFVIFQLEPHIFGQASFDYSNQKLVCNTPHFGIDESGKGDFFGPLVIAGVYVNYDFAHAFSSFGVQDSKRITSDQRIRYLAQQIRQSGAPLSIIAISPSRYNALFPKFGNLNKLLAWGHARVLENLCKKQPNCSYALSDQFADTALLQRALMTYGKKIHLQQRIKAESDIAVAAASILAREKFIDWLDITSIQCTISLPRGASKTVKNAARAAVEKHGPHILHKVAKTHFKTAIEVLIDPKVRLQEPLA